MVAQHPHEWIDTADALVAWCSEIRPEAIVALDTESDHFLAYNPYVALIQVATSADRAALVDPLALTADELAPLLELVERDDIIMIMHSARNDIGELDRDFGVRPRRIFDTQLAAEFLNYDSVSLGGMLSETAGITLDKKYQRFDWTRRPIPQGPRDYAVRDVVYLFDLRARLLRELEAEGWLEPFRQHMSHLIETSGYSETPFDPEGWRRIKGSKDLDDVGRAVCAALFVFRHELCSELDRAALHVLENGALLELARSRPRTLDALHDIRRLNKRTASRRGNDFLEVIRRAEDATPPPKRRPSTPGGRGRPTAEQRGREKALLELRRELAGDLGLRIELVMPRAAIDHLAFEPVSAVDQLGGVDGLLPWQVEHFGAQIIDRCSAT